MDKYIDTGWLLLGCLWFLIRDGGKNVFRFRAGWLSAVVAFCWSSMGVANCFLFRCRVAVLGCLWL